MSLRAIILVAMAILGIAVLGVWLFAPSAFVGIFLARTPRRRQRSQH